MHVTRWPLIAVGFFAGCAASFNMGKISIALPVLRDDLSISLVAGSSLVALFSVVIATCGFFAGFIINTAGVGRTLQVGLLASGLGSLGGAFAEQLIWLQVGRVVEGLGWLLIAVSVPAIFATIASKQDKPLVLGLWGAFVPAGMTVAFLVSPAILAATDWRVLWIVSGLFSLLWLLVVRYTFSAVSLPENSALNLRSLLASVSDSSVWLMAGWIGSQWR